MEKKCEFASRAPRSTTPIVVMRAEQARLKSSKAAAKVHENRLIT
jgi:hypothetical protein